MSEHVSRSINNSCLNQRPPRTATFFSITLKIVVSVSGVHRVMVELATATEKAIKAIAEGQAQLQKAVEKVQET